MPLLRCSSCRAQIELARPVLVERCTICGGVLLPPGSPVPQVLDDDPTRPRLPFAPPPPPRPLVTPRT